MTVKTPTFEPSASVRVAVLHGLASEMQQPQSVWFHLARTKSDVPTPHAVQDVHGAFPSQRMMERGWSGGKDLPPASKTTLQDHIMIEIKFVHHPLTWRCRARASKPYWTDRSTVDKGGLEKGVRLRRSGDTPNPQLCVIRNNQPKVQ
jgi:hypothetical protein